jgi:sporulation protein YlmC with PRC-barrel domain
MKSNIIKATNVIRLPSMRAFQTLVWPTMLCGLLMLAAPGPVLSQAVQLVTVDVNVVAQGYRVSKLTGNSVTNDKNEKVGTLDDFVIGHDRSLFAILQVGGFLGIGSRLVAVPYESLVINDETRKIELPGASKEELKKLAEFKYRI